MPAEPWQQGGFGLYIHWPFCQSLCPYCDFNSYVSERIDHARWQRAYLAELARAAEETGDRVLRSVFFGGGTPSLMQPDLVAAILEEVRRHWRIANDLEVTMEANPGSVEADRFRGYSEAGVNRISIGIQALDDDSLRLLGRLHSADEGRRAISIAQDNFARVSFDLIYARQHQTAEDWRRELTDALAIGTDHLSLYQLTIEDGTAFGARHAAGRLPGLPDEDLAADLYEITQELCEAAGMPAYEISNHARGDAASRHNLIYWQGGDYLGVGPGAHGRLTLAGQRWATDTHRTPGAWLDAVETTGNGETARSPIGPEDQAIEYLMMGLRVTDGIEISRAEPALDHARVERLVSDGFLWTRDGRIGATREGRMVLNGVLRELLA